MINFNKYATGLVFSIFVLLSANLNAGIFITEVINASSATSYDGSITIQATGNAGPFTAYLYRSSGILIDVTEGSPRRRDLDENQFIGSYKFNSLDDGSYIIRVYDRDGCETILYSDVGNCDIQIRFLDIKHATSYGVQDCNGKSYDEYNDGGIEIEVLSDADVEIIWAGPYNFNPPSDRSTVSLQELPPGAYTVEIRNTTTGCTVFEEITITVCYEINYACDLYSNRVFRSIEYPGTVLDLGSNASGRYLYPITTSSLYCNGSVTASIGDPYGITFSYWKDNDGNFITNDLHVDNLCAGEYCFVIDYGCNVWESCVEVGCRGEFEFDCNVIIYPEGIVSNEDKGSQEKSGGDFYPCIDSDDQVFSLSITNIIGGTEPYTYEWSDETVNTTGRLDNVTIDDYNVTITDANGCEMVVYDLVKDVKAVDTTFVARPCPGWNNGAIIFEILNPGEDPVYQYEGTSDDGYYIGREEKMSHRVDGLIAGDYEFRFNVGGCIITKNVTIEDGEYRKIFREHKDGVCYYDEYCKGVNITDITDGEGYFETPICDDPDGVDEAGGFFDVLDGVFGGIFNIADCCLESCGCPDYATLNPEANLIDVGESCVDYIWITGYEYQYAYFNLSLQLEWLHPSGYYILPLEDASARGCSEFFVCPLTLHYKVKRKGYNGSTQGTFIGQNEEGCDQYQCGFPAGVRTVCPEEIAADLGIDIDLNNNPGCSVRTGKIFDFISNHDIYKDTHTGYDGSEVADQVEELRDDDQYLNIPNYQCIDIVYCEENYKILFYSGYSASRYCDGVCSSSGYECVEFVDVEDDSQNRTNETDCGDGEDNDNDGYIDCADLDCQLKDTNKSLKSPDECSCPIVTDDFDGGFQQLLSFVEGPDGLGDQALMEALNKLLKLVEWYETCASNNWAPYKEPGFVPYCLWEDTEYISLAFQFGVWDGSYAFVDGINQLEDLILQLNSGVNNLIEAYTLGWICEEFCFEIGTDRYKRLLEEAEILGKNSGVWNWFKTRVNDSQIEITEDYLNYCKTEVLPIWEGVDLAAEILSTDSTYALLWLTVKDELSIYWDDISNDDVIAWYLRGRLVPDILEFIYPILKGKKGADLLIEIRKIIDSFGPEDWKRVADDIVERSVDDLLVNGRVPSLVGKAFHRWFDELTSAEFNLLWNSKYRSTIENRIRHPGGLHEWCMVCQTPKFKSWNISMDEIKRFRTDIPDLTWRVPDDVPNIGGQLGGHGTTGSTTFHNELEQIIINSSSVIEFNSSLTNLLVRWDIDPNLLPPFITM